MTSLSKHNLDKQSQNPTHIAITDENEIDASILDLKKIEDMMRAS